MQWWSISRKNKVVENGKEKEKEISVSQPAYEAIKNSLTDNRSESSSENSPSNSAAAAGREEGEKKQQLVQFA